MGFFKTFLAFTGYGSLAGAGTLAFMTRGSRVKQLPKSDYLYNSTFYARYNPEDNPPVSDVCVRRMPLSKIKPEYLEKDGKLVERFCAGVWSTLGYAYQRRYLEKKYRSEETSTQLWDQKDLAESTYPVGTRITDHFEVLAHTPESIIVRCGDSPRVEQVRASDGLFEMRAKIKQDEGVAEFELKSLLYQGLGKAADKPMPWHVELLHRWYAKAWMESAVRSLSK